MSVRVGRLQRKVLAVVLLLVVLPMLVAGKLSAHWVSQTYELSLERWIRESAVIQREALEAPQRNGELLAQVLSHLKRQGILELDAEAEPVPPELHALAEELGVTLVQLYTAERKLVYSWPAIQVITPWEPGQSRAMLKVRLGEQTLLASVAIVPLPNPHRTHRYLVLGSLLDRAYIDRVSENTGLDARLFYAAGPQEEAFHESNQPLAFRLPADAYRRIENKESYYSAAAEGGEYRALYTPVLDSTGRVEAVLFSGMKHRGAAEVIASETSLFVLIALLGCLVGGVTGLLLSRVVVRPVEHLRRAVLQLASQDFRVKLPDRQNDEVGELGRAFNAMAERLREARDEQLRQFRKEKLTAVGQLALTLAHEIRNPLGVIQTASSLLGKGPQDAHKQAALMRMIREESGRLGRLLQDFGHLAPVRSGRRQPVDPVQPLEKAIQLALAGRNDIRVGRRLSHGSATVYADPDLLEQAWINLVTNALQAVGDGPGEIQVTTGVDQGGVVISLEDSGPGIPVELVPWLFEPFFTTKAQGTGLGLTLAHNFFEANGGRLELEPSEGRGAKFCVRLPVYTETVEAERGVEKSTATARTRLT
jgi:two-component system, NtrC family, sensor kinase